MQRLHLFEDLVTTQEARIRRVVAALGRAGVRYALIGGHAVSFHTRPRVTVDVDFLFGGRATARIAAELAIEGFSTARRGDVLRAWDAGMDPDKDEPVADFLEAELDRTQLEALRTAIEVDYRGIRLPVVSRQALVALKFRSATSATREHGDRLQDAADISHVVRTGWSDADTDEAVRLVTLSVPAAGTDLRNLVDALRQGRPVTI